MYTLYLDDNDIILTREMILSRYHFGFLMRQLVTKQQFCCHKSYAIFAMVFKIAEFTIRRDKCCTLKALFENEDVSLRINLWSIMDKKHNPYVLSFNKSKSQYVHIHGEYLTRGAR